MEEERGGQARRQGSFLCAFSPGGEETGCFFPLSSPLCFPLSFYTFPVFGGLGEGDRAPY